MFKLKLLSIITVLAIFLVMGTSVFAVANSLNQEVDVEVTVNPEQVNPVYIYSDVACTTKLAGLNFTYNQGEMSSTITAFMKTTEVLSLGLETGDNIPINPGSELGGITITATVGLTTSDVTPILITAQGGSQGNYLGHITFIK